MFILNAIRQINPAWKFSDLRLKDVRCGRGPVRHTPLVPVLKQRRFLLRPSKRDTKVAILVSDAKRVPGEVANQRGDLFISDNAAIDLTRFADGNAVGYELERADAIAADRAEEAIGVCARSVGFFSYLSPDTFVIGKQVFKDRRHRLADVSIFTQRQ